MALNSILMEIEFTKRKVMIDEQAINITAFTSSFTSSDWSDYILDVISPSIDEKTPFDGPAFVLAATNNFSIPQIMAQAYLEVSPQTIHQRSFGEAMEAVFQSAESMRR